MSFGFGFGFYQQGGGGGGVPAFDPNSIAGLKQLLLVSTAIPLSGVIADERTGLGDDRPKQPGRAYDLDGVTARIQSNIDLTGTDALTGFVRFNLTGLTPLDYLMDQSVTATGFGFRITDLGQLQFFRYTSGFPVMVATSAGTVNIVSVGQDHSAAFVFSSTSVKFYLDGALIHTVTTPSNALAVSGGSTHIGGQVSGSVGTLHGKLYEAHAFKNRALSDEDILALHNHTYEGEIGEIFYTCEDNHPTTAFNSGTGVNGLKIGISPASFHFEGDTPYSFQNEVGYTDNGDGSFTPHNGNNATLDANGNVLQFSGEAPCPAQAVNSPCINLNGTTQYAQTNIPSNLPALSGDRSFASRFVVDGFSVATGLANRIVTQSQTNSSRFVFAVDNGNLAASAAGVGTVRGSTPLVVGETYTGFISYDYDAGELRLYLNGVLDGVQTGVSAPEDTNAEPMRIGSQNGNLARFFRGDLYDVEMFSYAATAEQVLQWHNGELHGDVAIFPFSEGAGSVCGDVVGDFTCSLMGNASNTWATQDDFHASLALGFDRVGTFDGTAYVEFPSVTSLASKTVKLTFQYTEGEQQIFQISTGSRYLAATLNSTRGGSADFVVGTGAHPLSDIKYLTKTGGFTSGGLYELEAVLDGNSRLIAAFIDGVALVDSDADTRVQTTAVAQHRLGIRLAGGFEYAGALCNYSISDFGTFAMAENSGTNVPDTSGNGNDGTLSGDDGSNFWANRIPANLDGTSRVRDELSNPAAYDSDGVWQAAIGQDFINIAGFNGVYTGGDGFDGVNNFSRITPNGEGRMVNVDPAPTGEDLRKIEEYTAKHTLNVLLVGQSVINDLTTAHSNAGGLAMETLAQSLGYTTVNIVNGAKDAASFSFDGGGAAGAYLDAADNKGLIYNNELENAVTASGIAKADFGAVIVMGGNTEAESIQDGRVTEAQVKTSYKALFDILKTDFPNANLISVENIKDQSTDFTGWEAMRRAQHQVRQENSFIKESPAFYDIELVDGVHPASSGTVIMGERWARLLAGLDGLISPVGTVGPRAISGTWDQTLNRIFITIEHDGGTDFTVGDDEIGFTYFANGAAANPFNNTVARVDATTFRYNLSSALASGSEVQANWLYGSGRNLNRANVLRDNSANNLPLKDFHNLILTEI